MGYMRHHAIMVTGLDGPGLVAIHKHACKLFPAASPLTEVSVNFYRSFFIPPDGSKERWEESESGDRRREEFKRFLREHGDGGAFPKWVEVQYGDDQFSTRIVDDSDADAREPDERWT